MSEDLQEMLAAQREAGWPDMHPESLCHRCGNPNPTWHTDTATWFTATFERLDRGVMGICCPTCLAELFEAATGTSLSWKFVPDYELTGKARIDVALPIGSRQINDKGVILIKGTQEWVEIGNVWDS